MMPICICLLDSVWIPDHELQEIFEQQYESLPLVWPAMYDNDFDIMRWF